MRDQWRGNVSARNSQGVGESNAMHRQDAISRDKLLDGLIKLFYVAMAMALLTTLMGSPGWGFLFLVFGSCALVIRTTMETLQRPRSRPSQSPPPPANR